MQWLIHAVLAAGAVSLLTGCGDPFVGTWEEATPNCGTPSTFTVEDDLTGNATIYVAAAGCGVCTFTFETEESGDGVYDGPIAVTDAACAALCAATGHATCVLEDDEETADCSVSAGFCSERDIFRKVSD